ncbi:MAG: hypothetical protein NZ992_06210 [Candidatus Korarchaeum sp.]|nr:hypothetical protein [Candidatus Korarchaeum sp.]MDW8035220.1 hypothetical protein [Candidatus Korarchaeum sp.]
MPERDERVKNLLMLREFLKRRVEKLEKELISLRRMIESLDEVLLEQTLVTADKLRGAESQVGARVEERRFYSEGGKLLGNLRISGDRLEVSFLPEEKVLINTKERPIRFLFRKVEELDGKVEIEEDPKGTLKLLKVRLKDPKDLDRALSFMRWALSRSVSQ